jgi:hypothetical protein
MKRTVFMVSAISCTLVLGTCNLAVAQFPAGHFFLDDFEDGSLSDASPVRWGRGAWNGATESIVDGSALIAGTRGASALAPRTDNNSTFLGYGDITIQTQVRVIDPVATSTLAGLFARSPDPRSYFIDINTLGNFRINELVNSSTVTHAEIQTALDVVSNDIQLRVDFQGDEIYAWAWDAGLPMPAEPLLTVTDGTLSYGTIGMYAITSDSESGSVAFRWFEVSEVIPEPSSLALVSAAVCLGLTRRRQRTSNRKNN